MSKCSNTDTRFFKTPNAGICDICHPCETTTKLEATAMCPPIGEPKCLTMMAPVVFDECGINLCRVFSIDDLVDACEGPTNRTTDIVFDGLTTLDLKNANTIQVKVVDIDFNFICPETCRYSEIKPSKNTPNLSRVVLRDIDVTFVVSIMDSTCKVCKEGMMTLRYLPGENCPGYSEDTNPSNIAFDLYTPYGISYAPENPAGCNKLVPTINYIGFVENQHCQNCNCPEPHHVFREFEANNSLRQGISAQGLAKVIGKDDDCMAIGLTMYFKVVYFVQYKFHHEGLCVPPKFLAVNSTEVSSCKEFCDGDLLEPCIQPLNVGERPKCLEQGCGCTPRRPEPRN
ncbi:hypothetical protein [Niameybacter massiliensis]|nr:hypothetical protein [Niameybacter massiliensis]